MNTRPRILYVDDEQWLMEGIIDYLSKGFEIIPARNADQALALLKKEQKIQLIILDIMLPPGDNLTGTDRGRRTGLELARIIRKEMRLEIPIICYTVVLDSALAKELYAVGVQEIMSKTKLPSELEQRIRYFLNK